LNRHHLQMQNWEWLYNIILLHM